jgi:hypothetical protein
MWGDQQVSVHTPTLWWAPARFSSLFISKSSVLLCKPMRGRVTCFSPCTEQFFHSCLVSYLFFFHWYHT